MAVNYLEVIFITASTVGKVLLCCIARMVISRFYAYGRNTEKGLTYLSVRVFTPLLLFSRLCQSITLESMKLYYWGILLAFFPMIIGTASAWFCRLFLNRTYLGMLILSCAFQNGLTFPVSLILNLKGVNWFGPREAEEGSDLIFLYNIVCAIGLWGVGEPVISYFKALEVQEEKQKRQFERLQELAAKKDPSRAEFYGDDAEGGEVLYPYSRTSPPSRLSTANDKEGSNELMNSFWSHSQHASTKQQLLWYKPTSIDDEPLSVDDIDAVENERHSNRGQIKEGKRWGSLSKDTHVGEPSNFLWIVLNACKGLVVVASIVGFLVPIISPLNWGAKSMAGQIIVDAFALIGGGAIPMQLLVLGGSISPTSNRATQDIGSPENSPIKEKKNSWASALQSQEILFIVSSICIRSIFTPAVMFLVIHALSRLAIVPSDRVFLLSMLVATSAPSAINSSIICVMHDYHAREFARMIFIVYVTAFFFSTVWLSIYIMYLH